MIKQRMIVVGDSTFAGDILEGAKVKVLSVTDGVAQIDDGRTQDLIMVSDLKPDLDSKICPMCFDECEDTDSTIEEDGICEVCSFWMKTIKEIKSPDSREEKIKDIWVTDRFDIYYCLEFDEEGEFAHQNSKGTPMICFRGDGTRILKHPNVTFLGTLPEEFRRGIEPNTAYVEVVYENE